MEANLRMNVKDEVTLDVAHKWADGRHNDVRIFASGDDFPHHENKSRIGIGIRALHLPNGQDDVQVEIVDSRWVRIRINDPRGSGHLFEHRFCIDRTHMTANAVGPIAEGQAVVQYEGDPLLQTKLTEAENARDVCEGMYHQYMEIAMAVRHWIVQGIPAAKGCTTDELPAIVQALVAHIPAGHPGVEQAVTDIRSKNKRTR